MEVNFGSMFSGLGDGGGYNIVGDPASEDQSLNDILASSGTNTGMNWAADALNEAVFGGGTTTAAPAAPATYPTGSVNNQIFGTDSVPTNIAVIGANGVMNAVFGDVIGGGGAPTPGGSTSGEPQLLDAGVVAQVSTKVTGESLADIATRFGTTIEALQKENPNFKPGGQVNVRMYLTLDGEKPDINAMMHLPDTTGGGGTDGTGQTGQTGQTGTGTPPAGGTGTTPPPTGTPPGGTPPLSSDPTGLGLNDLTGVLSSLNSGDLVSGTANEQLEYYNKLLDSLKAMEASLANS